MILIHVDPLTFKYGAQTMIFWSRALLRLFLQCFFKMAVLYCLNDNLSSKMNFQHFNIHKLHMQTQKKQIQDKKKWTKLSCIWCMVCWVPTLPPCFHSSFFSSERDRKQTWPRHNDDDIIIFWGFFLHFVCHISFVCDMHLSFAV